MDSSNAASPHPCEISSSSPSIADSSNVANSPTCNSLNLEDAVSEVPPSIARRLYLSHFLSTWNSRVFEFGAVLYLASIFPNTLLPMSIYALTRGASAIAFSPAVGRYIDTHDRLQVVRLSIVLQRLAVAASCAVFWFLATKLANQPASKLWILALLALLACVEKLCSIMNVISVERDWVVLVAGDDDSSLRVLNAQMRRIDLVCKLAGPFVIALVDGISTEAAILLNFAMNAFSIPVEYYAIARVYEMVPALRASKQSSVYAVDQGTPNQGLQDVQSRGKHAVFEALKGLRFYVQHRAFLPSFAGSLLYFTVLSFSGQMITYLLSVGYNSFHIAVARTGSVVFEISATWIAPLVMSKIGPIRAGIWFLSWQMLSLAAGACLFWGIRPRVLAATGLVGSTILSRIGLWGFDLSAQIIVQEEVEPEYRGSFSSIEASWQNTFELCSYATTIVFSRSEQFQWPVLMSCIAVFIAGGLYTTFVRSRRGHLFHLPVCFEFRGNKTVPQRPSYERLPFLNDE